MNSESQHLKVVLLDNAALKSMRFIEMMGRIDQIRATGRYADIHLDYRRMAVVAEVLA